MENTPMSLRRHIALYGKVNSGKSTLFNAMLEQNTSIVSPENGTTTDPVMRSMELIPYGPIVLVDTAGTADGSVLGAARMSKTNKALERCDIICHVISAENYNDTEKLDFSVPIIVVFTKCDLVSENELNKIKSENKHAVFVENNDLSSFKLALSKALLTLENGEEDFLIGDLVPNGEKVILVMPIDSEAPKGRIILPQMQVLRDCLDHHIKSYVVQTEELSTATEDINPYLVVTDSQAFKEVSDILPNATLLTSFSMLLARQKGNFAQLLSGIDAIKNLHENSNILVLEGCTHTRSHEDIGQVKIPKLLEKHVGCKLNFTHVYGYDFPDDFEKYALVIHCGGCMISKKAIENRLSQLNDFNIPVTNYGIILAFLNGILERATEVFMKKH